MSAERLDVFDAEFSLFDGGDEMPLAEPQILDKFGLPELITLIELEVGNFVAPFKEVFEPESAIDFAHETLGHKTWDIPAQILRDIDQPRARVAVKSCHASGKTFTAAEVVLWWTCSVGGIALTSAPTGRQARKVLWGEIKKQHRRANRPLGGYMLETSELRYSEVNYALGFATDDPHNWHGFHADKLLIVLDEAPGISDETYDAIMGIAAGGDVRILLLGNPVIVGGRFWKIFHEERSLWKTYSIDAFDTPNLRDLNLHDPHNFQDFIDLDPHDPLLSENSHPYLVTRHYIHEAYHLWGADNPQWQSRVRGQFPEFDEYSMFHLSWLEQARVRRFSESELLSFQFEAGLDIAGPGADETSLCIREGPRIHKIWASQKADTKQDVLALIRKYQAIATAKGKTFRLKVDADGIGYHYAVELRKEGIPITMMRASAKPRTPDRFAKAKDEMYWELREACSKGMIAGLDDDETISQAVQIRYEEDRLGRITVESKQDLRKRGFKSPDRLESVVLAFARPQGLSPSSRGKRAPAGRTYKRKSRHR